MSETVSGLRTRERGALFRGGGPLGAGGTRPGPPPRGVGGAGGGAGCGRGLGWGGGLGVSPKGRTGCRGPGPVGGRLARVRQGLLGRLARVRQGSVGRVEGRPATGRAGLGGVSPGVGGRLARVRQGIGLRSAPYVRPRSNTSPHRSQRTSVHERTPVPIVPIERPCTNEHPSPSFPSNVLPRTNTRPHRSHRTSVHEAAPVPIVPIERPSANQHQSPSFPSNVRPRTNTRPHQFVEWVRGLAVVVWNGWRGAASLR